jgi:hypothetical protein
LNIIGKLVPQDKSTNFHFPNAVFPMRVLLFVALCR